jgi:hypothetical protein
MEKIKIYYVDYLPNKFRGMCIPPIGIFILKKHKGNKKIIQHDLIHWEQYKKLGALQFYLNYLIQYGLVGYDKMPMEMEARKYETPFARNNYRLLYHR